LGLHAGSFTTFWNVAGDNGLNGRSIENNFGPWLNFVGNPNGFPSQSSNAITRSWVFEPIDFSRYTTRNLYKAMRALRLYGSPTGVSGGGGNTGKVSARLGGKGGGGVLLSAPIR
jgi:hypothetical protein